MRRFGYAVAGMMLVVLLGGCAGTMVAGEPDDLSGGVYRQARDFKDLTQFEQDMILSGGGGD